MPNSEFNNSMIKNILWFICKWGIAIIGFVYLLNEGMFSSSHFSFSSYSAPWLVGSLACALVSEFGTATRFHFVLLQLGQSSCLLNVARMFFSGLFFQQIGSNFAFDGMRIIMLRKQGLPPAVIGTSILADRLFGVSTIFLIAFFFSVYYLRVENLHWVIGGSLVLIAAIPICFIVFRRVCGSSINDLWLRIPGIRLILAMGEALELLARNPVHVGLLALYSFLPFLTMLFASYCNARALAIPLSCGEAMAGASFASLTSILPLPLSGVGIGESAFGWVVATLRGAGEIVDYAPVFFIHRFFILTIGCFSWVIIMCVNTGKQKRQ